MYYSSYRNRNTGEIISREQLLKLFYNTSFPPSPWPQFVYDQINYDPVYENLPPQVDNLHIVVNNGLIKNNNGEWVTDWRVEKKFKDVQEEEAFILLEQNKELLDKWISIKISRSLYLAETDFTQLPDTPISSESREAFKLYRQQLRDVTSQPDPFNIIWPEKPNYVKF